MYQTMYETIELQKYPESHPSLCIPRVSNTVEESIIRTVFEDIGLGKIHHVDIVVRKNDNGESFKRVYIHFDKWYWNQEAQEVRRKLISGREIKIVYDTPWFWKMSANKWSNNYNYKKEQYGATTTKYRK